MWATVMGCINQAAWVRLIMAHADNNGLVITARDSLPIQVCDNSHLQGE
ncbi:MAG: hypothetical protein MZV63_20265 [Marinilabiliales bacterium]|nr:hypothetical protein [Marinilabiliales bacterium]